MLEGVDRTKFFGIVSYGLTHGWFAYVCIGFPSMPKREIVESKCYIIILSMMSNLLTIGEIISNLLYVGETIANWLMLSLVMIDEEDLKRR